MSNALWTLAQSAPGLGPSGPEPVSPYFTALLAASLPVMAGWCIVRALRPRKVLLRRVPGRRARDPALLMAGTLVVYLGNLMLLGFAQKVLADYYGAPVEQLGVKTLLPALIFVQALLGLVSLALARAAFRHGVARGMGVSARHWLYDTGRGIVGFLVILPPCYGALQAMHWLIQNRLLPVNMHKHPLLVFLSGITPPWLTVVVISTVVLAPIVEEVFFRGLLQSALKQFLPNPWIAILLASAAFALAHGRQYQDMPALFILGVALGYNYERSGRLLAPMLMHAIFNAVMIVSTLTA